MAFTFHSGRNTRKQPCGETVQNDFYDEIIEKSEKAREEARVLYVAMTRSIRSFSWIEIQGKHNLSWQNLIETEV